MDCKDFIEKRRLKVVVPDQPLKGLMTGMTLEENRLRIKREANWCQYLQNNKCVNSFCVSPDKDCEAQIRKDGCVVNVKW